MIYRIDTTEEFLEDFTRLFNEKFYESNYTNIRLKLIRDSVHDSIESVILEGSPIDSSGTRTGGVEDIVTIPLKPQHSEVIERIKEFEIIEHIIELEAKQYNEDSYLDEGEHGELYAFYESLGRELRMAEWERVKILAKELLGEEE